MTTLAERLEGAVWGHLIGDAVGVPYEFTSTRPATSVVFGAKGSHHQPAGTWSDDGALMLALLDSMLQGTFDLEDQGRRAVAWYRDKAYTPDGDGLFDIGNATSSALRAIVHGTPAAEAGATGEQAGGNGSLMRILPIALLDRDATDSVLIEHVEQASRVTHGYVRPRVACALYVLIAARLLRGSGGREAVLADARASLRSNLTALGNSEMLAALDHLEGYTERAGKGRVWDSFWSAWDAFAGAKDYRDTIQRAVAYGNDTDTTAAIAGGLAGIRWGIEGIPAEWLAGMRGKDVVEPLIAKLLTTVKPAAAPSNPLRVNVVPFEFVPGLASASGRLGMTFLPGKNGISGISGSHDRVLEEDAATLHALGVNALVLLVEDPELDAAHVPDVVRVLTAHGVETIRFPIKDQGVPSDKAATRALLNEIEAKIKAGSFIAVACMGGLGRTGTIVGSLLRQNGLDAAAAVDLTRRSRHGAIENKRQEAFVAAWARDSA